MLRSERDGAPRLPHWRDGLRDFLAQTLAASSGDQKQIVGIVRVIGEHQPDPTDDTGKFGLVVLAAVEDMPKPVTLTDIKSEAKLKDMVLVKNSRLSVQPVRDAEWKLVCKMGGLKTAP